MVQEMLTLLDKKKIKNELSLLAVKLIHLGLSPRLNSSHFSGSIQETNGAILLVR
jgi:hypothetical protein